jgi:hypothetical protein
VEALAKVSAKNQLELQQVYCIHAELAAYRARSRGGKVFIVDDEHWDAQCRIRIWVQQNLLREPTEAQQLCSDARRGFVCCNMPNKPRYVIAQ